MSITPTGELLGIILNQVERFKITPQNESIHNIRRLCWVIQATVTYEHLNDTYINEKVKYYVQIGVL